MIKRLCVLAFLGARVLLGWGCEGHQAVARLAEMNLTPHAKAEVQKLLSQNPIDPNLIRFCAGGLDDLMSSASTWPDDIRRFDGTGKWHYMDIPRQATAGDPMKWCEPVGPPDPNEHNERPGCVLTAIVYNRKILADDNASPADRAKALRYLIHFVGDLHMPLHTTGNQDSGGNCTDMVLLDSNTLANLHSIWDSGILEHHLHDLHQTPARIRGRLEHPLPRRRKPHGPPPQRPSTIGSGVPTNKLTTSPTARSSRPSPLEPEQGKNGLQRRNAEGL